MTYEMDMGSEKEPARRVLLDEGWRNFKIIDCEEQTSKAGNLMFVFTLLDGKSGHEDKLYAVAEKGKRWMLKAILSAVGIEPNEGGTFEWDIPDVINKEFAGEVVHKDNKWIDRSGEKRVTKQHRIVRVKKTDDQIAWDE